MKINRKIPNEYHLDVWKRWIEKDFDYDDWNQNLPSNPNAYPSNNTVLEWIIAYARDYQVLEVDVVDALKNTYLFVDINQRKIWGRRCYRSDGIYHYFQCNTRQPGPDWQPYPTVDGLWYLPHYRPIEQRLANCPAPMRMKSAMSVARRE